MRISTLLSLLMAPLACQGDLLDYYSQCTQWLKTNGSNCAAPTPHSTFKFSWGANWTSPFENNVCCADGTGCFSIEIDSPFSCHNHLPKCMDEVRPEFFFYTPDKKQQVQMVDYFSLDSSAKQLVVPAQPARPFFVIVHGFGGDWPKSWMFNMKDRLVNLGNNVMIVRWTGGAKDPMYFHASANTRTVGAAIAKVVKTLDANKKVAIGNTTIIGFSLGGQIAGFAGSNIPNLRRILAIDPAGPMFQCMPPEARLDPTDAQFVQAIHTNGDYFLMGGCGTLQQFGHMDVYMNGGSQQPGCPRGTAQSFRSMSDLNFNGMVESVSCSHNRVPKLLTEIIELAADPDHACQFIGFPCDSPDDWRSGKCFKCPAQGCPKIGYLTDLNNRRSGKFFVNSLADNETSGYYCGKQVLITALSSVKVRGNISILFNVQGHNDTIVTIQSIDDTMPPVTPKSAVGVLPHNFQITNASIIYHKNKNWIGGGPASWSLSSLTIEQIDGKRFTNKEAVEVKDGQPVAVSFKPVDK